MIMGLVARNQGLHLGEKGLKVLGLISLPATLIC
jgi:hypothetical protein